MTRIATALAALLLLSTAIAAQESTFHDAASRVTGKAHTDMNGVTTFSDAAGRTSARAQTDLNGVTHFYDAAGRVTGSVRQR